MSSPFNITRRKLSDSAGASIVIALVFFLICAVVGSVVLTAASINAKAVATHRDTQQAEYATTSAAKAIAEQLAPSKPPSASTPAVPSSVELVGASNALKIKEGTIKAPDLMAKLLQAWNDRTDGSTVAFELTDPLTVKVGNRADLDAYAWVEFDRDFNLIVTVSTDLDRSKVSDYKQTITVQSIPTFNNAGQMLKCEWEKPVISKYGA